MQADDESSLLASYSDIASALKSDSAVKLSRLSLIPTTDIAAKSIGLAYLFARGRLIELDTELLKELALGWHEAVIYPNIGPMDANEVAEFLTRDLNRAGEGVAVTLTLTDGQYVSGYPLAIRKSAIGGALVELADPKTKLKGQEIPLDRISSIAYDLMAS